jgi:DNA-binding SARP family transcriptional activator/tetratricopeptide (TPR) repeat protein
VERAPDRECRFRRCALTRLRVSLLGAFEVAVDGHPVSDFESASTKALLALLAYEPGRPLRRAVVAEMLWPDRPDGMALANLRHSLAVLRHLLGDRDRDPPFLTVTRDTVALRAGTDVWVDVDQLRRLARTPPTAPGVAATWEAVTALRRGPLLADTDPVLGGAWDDWLSVSRAESDRTAAELLRRLADLRERAGRYQQALDASGDEIRIDPWSETAHARVIRLLALLGRSAEGVAHGETFTRDLHDHLGMPPSPQFLALVEDVRHGRLSARPPAVPGLPERAGSRSEGEVCVARDDELGWLHQHLEDAVSGSGRMVFIEGAAGSGKSVLLRAFAAGAHDRTPGLLVLRGVCNAHAGPGDPYLPYRQMLDLLCGDLERAWLQGDLTPTEADALWAGAPAAVDAVLDVGPYLLGSMVDGAALAHRIAEGFPGTPEAHRLASVVEEAAWRAGDPMRRQHPVLDQFVSVIARLSAAQPMLLVVDDLHSADLGTIDLTRHLAEAIGDLPVLLVGALRPAAGTGPEGAADPVTGLVDEVRSRSRADCLLRLTGTRRFVDAWLDTEPNLLDEDFREDLYRHTSGHALFTVEMVAAMRDRGDLVRDDRGRWVTGAPVDWSWLPPRAEATIAARIDQLPAETRRDLEVASVEGDEFIAQVVAWTRHAPEDETARRLGALTAPTEALVEYVGSEQLGAHRVHRYRFRHALFRQFLYDRLAEQDRALLHEAVARSLVALHPDRVDDIATDLAWHFDAAGDVGAAIDHHHRAGRRAVAMSASDVAVAHLSRALELTGRTAPSPERDRLELGLLALLGGCLEARAGYNAPETTEVYERIRGVLRTAEPSMESAVALGALTGIDGLRGRYDDAIAGSRALLAMSDRAGGPPTECLAHMQLGWLLLMRARLAEAEQHLDRAIEMYDPAWDPWLTPAVGTHVRSAALAWRALLDAEMGRFDRARRDSARSIEESRRVGFPFGLVFTLSVAGCAVFLPLEEGDQVVRHAEEAALIAEREDFASYRSAAQFYRGLGLALTGSVRSALPAIEQGITGWCDLGTEAFRAWFRCAQAEQLVAGGELDRAAEVVGEVEELLATGEESAAGLWLPLSRAALQRARGDDVGAEATLRSGLAMLGRADARGLMLRTATALARLYRDHGRGDDASAVLHPLVASFTEGQDTASLRAARAVLGADAT